MQPNNPYYPPGPNTQQPMHQGSPQQPMFQQAPPQGANGGSRKPVGLVVTLVIVILLLLGAAGFGYWAFTERQDYKNNSDKKVNAAVEAAVQETTDKNNLRFAEESKNPLKEYRGPAAYGSVKLKYPKTWSGYIDQTSSTVPLQMTFHPNVIPAVRGTQDQQAIALKIDVTEQPYDQVLNRLKSSVDRGDTLAEPYALPSMPEEVGLKFTGKISTQFNGTQIVIPIRDKTLIVTTETDQFLTDFNTHILPNISFVP